MARIIARRDTAEGYVFIRSGDAYAVPDACRQIIKRNGGEFSGDTKEWRLPIHRGADVVASIRVDGHTVITVDTNDPRPALTLLECRGCGAPYSANLSLPAPGSTCARCHAALELVPPHVCTDECEAQAAARSGA